jgi:hypothetical protein
MRVSFILNGNQRPIALMFLIAISKVAQILAATMDMEEEELESVERVSPCQLFRPHFFLAMRLVPDGEELLQSIAVHYLFDSVAVATALQWTANSFLFVMHQDLKLTSRSASSATY